MFEALPKFFCDLRQWADPFEKAQAGDAQPIDATGLAPSPSMQNPAVNARPPILPGAKGPTSLRRQGQTPAEQYQFSFQDGQAKALLGDEEGVSLALNKMRHFQEKAGIKPDEQKQNEKDLYASLYDATLQSGKDEIEGYQSDGGRGRNFKRALDPFLEKNFDRKNLFAKLERCAAKAGIPPEQLEHAKLEIDRSLYDYYQSQALSYGEKAKRGVDVGADLGKFVSKMRELGPEAGYSKEKIEEDAKALYRGASGWRNTSIKNDEKIFFPITYVTSQEEIDKIEKETSQFRSELGSSNDPSRRNLFQPESYQNFDYASLQGGTLVIDHRDPQYDTCRKPIRVVVGKEGGYITSLSKLGGIMGEVYYYFPPSDKERVVLIDHRGKLIAPQLRQGECRPEGIQNYDIATLNSADSLIPEGFPSVLNKVPETLQARTERNLQRRWPTDQAGKNPDQKS